MLEIKDHNPSLEKQTAFMKAYAPCHDAFIRYCSALTYGKQPTDDLVQDVLLSAYEHFDNIIKKDQFLHYLIRAARNRSVSYWRKSKYKAELLDQQAERLQAQGLSPETSLDIQALYRALDQLPEKQKDALILFEITGFSTKEIAELQDCKDDAVRARISRGRKKLREIMREKRKLPILAFLFGKQPTNSIHMKPSSPEEEIFSLLRQLAPEIKQEEALHLIQKPSLPVSAPNSYHIYLNSFIGLGCGLCILVGMMIWSLPSKEALSQQIIPSSEYFKLVSSEEERKELKTVSSKVALDIETDSKEIINLSSLDFQKGDLSLNFQPISFQIFENVDQTPYRDYVKMPKTIHSTSFNTQFQAPSQNAKPQDSHDLDDACAKPLQFAGDIKKFKRELLKRLLKDRLIESRQAGIFITFSENKLALNHSIIPQPYAQHVLDLMALYNVLPCPDRIIEISSDFIAVGDVFEKGLRGRFKGKGIVKMKKFHPSVEAYMRKSPDHITNIDVMSNQFYVKYNSQSSTIGIDKPKRNTSKLYGPSYYKTLERIDIAPFHTLKIKGESLTVYLAQGDSSYFKVEEELADHIKVELKDGILHLEGKPSDKDSKKELRIFVQTPYIKTVDVSKGARVFNQGIIKTMELNVIASLLGEAYLKIDVGLVNIKLTEGNITLMGKAQRRNIDGYKPKNYQKGRLHLDDLK